MGINWEKSLCSGASGRVVLCQEFGQNISKAVTTGTRSGSGKTILDFYNKLCPIYGGSPATEPLPYGVETGSFETYQRNESEVVDPRVVEDEQEQDLDDVDDHVNENSPGFLKRLSANQVPVLIYIKRKYLKKKPLYC